MNDPFVHLRVASGYSLRHGAASCEDLVTRAADHEMDTLALTDRDGVYGMVRFAKACQKAGIAPVLGVDLAVPWLTLGERGEAPGLSTRPSASLTDRGATPARGGRLRDLRLPRVVLYATSKAGWAALCRLVSATHLAGERGVPIADPAEISRYAAGGELVCLLGPDSELGHAVAARRDLAEEVLHDWQQLLPPGQLVIGTADLQIPGAGPGSLPHAARMLALGDAERVPVVLINQVRMVSRDQAPVLDVLDSARRLVPLDARNVDRRNAEAWLKSGKEMLQVAQLVAQRGGRGPGGAERLFADTRNLAIRCRLDPRDDLGLGEIHLPEFEVLSQAGSSFTSARQLLAARCEAGIARRYGQVDDKIRRRLDDELAVIGRLGFESYFLTVADTVDLVREMGIRAAARGSGAGSLVNYLLGISGVDPLRYGLIMERFLSPLRQSLPDIDVDVESARREEVYQKILDTFGGERVACVAMMDTYRVRHAVRDVGAALSLPPGEIDAIAKAFPHIRARDARAALRDLPELRAAGLAERRLDLLFDLVEALDGLPRHVALHPCGVLLSDATLLDRTPVEASHGGFPMSQFDKDDVEDLGLLKLDVLGIRMQSAMAHAVTEIRRTTGEEVDLDALADDGFTDPATYELIDSTHTLGCFQIESPGQRELIGKFQPADFTDIIIDISLFRPGPVKSDMVRPFLNARHGWERPRFVHDDLRPFLAETEGVVVFHEQVIQLFATMTGCSLAQGDEARRALGNRDLQPDVKHWYYDRTLARGYNGEVADEVWRVLESFASFGFCKAHAAAFALPTYQSAWLKAHWPAHFLAGVLTHDPGMYPKRLILEEVRRLDLEVFGLDINRSTGEYVAEEGADGRWGIRLSLADVKGISETEIERIVAGQPYSSLNDLWHRAQPSAALAEKLILAGAFDGVHLLGRAEELARHGRLTRRDLLLALADLQREDRSARKAASRARGLRRVVLASATPVDDPATAARRQSQRSAAVTPQEIQMPLELGTGATDGLASSGLPEMPDSERVRAELDILGLDASRHVVDFYAPLMDALGVTRSSDLMEVRHREGLLVAGVKVATQTPPVRSGRRVVFCTLDDASGPVDATFFEDVQGPYARTLFDSWLLLIRGDLRRTGERGVSLLATGCWDLTALYATWGRELELTGDRERAKAVVLDEIEAVPESFGGGPRRVLVHPSGFRQSAYADIKPAGATAGAAGAPRKLWHSSPGSSGR